MIEADKKRIAAEVAETFDRALRNVYMPDHYRQVRTSEHIALEVLVWKAVWAAIGEATNE